MSVKKKVEKCLLVKDIMMVPSTVEKSSINILLLWTFTPRGAARASKSSGYLLYNLSKSTFFRDSSKPYTEGGESKIIPRDSEVLLLQKSEQGEGEEKGAQELKTPWKEGIQFLQSS